MKNTLRSIVLAASVLASVAAFAAGPTEVAREDRATLDAYRTVLVRGLLDGKPAGIAPHLAETVRLLAAYQRNVTGRADAALYYVAFLKRFDVTAFERQPVEITAFGARVMEIGRFTMTLVDRASAETHAFTGKYMDLWQKSAAGKLELHTAGWNHDQAPAFAERLRFAEVPSAHLALQARVPVTGGISFEIAALQKLQESAIAQHDGKLWALYYADDAILLANLGGVVSGRQALDEFTLEHVKRLPVFEKLDLRTHQIDDFGEFVVEYSSGVVNWRVNEWSGVSLGKGIIVWRRQEGGGLRIWRAISMYD